MNRVLVRLGLWGVCVGVVSLCLGYLPPCEERQGVRVEVQDFPQKIERPGENPYAWPLGVTEVTTPKCKFHVAVENKRSVAVTGTLQVWMNDDWQVQGELPLFVTPKVNASADKVFKNDSDAGVHGAITLQPNEKRVFVFTGSAKDTALEALYPVHARFIPQGQNSENGFDLPHPIAVFMFKNPNAPRALPVVKTPELGVGEFTLNYHFKRTSAVSVNGKEYPLPESGISPEWGGGMTAGWPNADGVAREGFHSHPPYYKGAGFIWSDFPLALPAITPLKISSFNFLVSNAGQPPSDGVEYKIFVLEEGKEPQLVCTQIIKKILTWYPMSGDLSPWAGKKVTLRLWTGPGPKMNTCCDGGGWGDVKLIVGSQPMPPTEAQWLAREQEAVGLARTALQTGSVKNGWRLGAYGAGVVYGARGLEDGVLAFTDGTKDICYRGFTVKVGTVDGGVKPKVQADLQVKGDTLQITWSMPETTRDRFGYPRFEDLAVGPANTDIWRIYAGFGNVVEKPKAFALHVNGFELSTRHVGADYMNGFSIVQASNLIPDKMVVNGDKKVFALHAHHDVTFTFVPSNKGAFEAARRFRAVSGYKKSPGHDKLGARMCLDQWSGDYTKAARGIKLSAKYGLNDSIFVKHDWQCWGYDYRLPEIYPPRGDADAFGKMREACGDAGILFCPHDNYTDIYPDAENYSYNLTVFNLDGTPQKAWFNAGRHALSYRWAPHAFHPWCLRNAKLLKAGYDPDSIFIDVFTAHGPFDYLDREGNFHSKNETSACWAKGFGAYRQGFERPDTVCVSEAGQDHLVGVADAGQSDHFGANRWFGKGTFADSDRTPWHDIVTHGYYVLFAGGLGGRYQEEGWSTGGDAQLHGYASDDYLSNCIIGGRNPMSDGPFSRNAVKTYWLQHDACADLGKAEFLDLQYGENVHQQHSFFSAGEVWINRATNATWKVAGYELPSYGYYAKTVNTESGIILKDGVRCAFAKGKEVSFYDARKPGGQDMYDAVSHVISAKTISRNQVRLQVAWETKDPAQNYQAFVHICKPKAPHEGIVFQGGLAITPTMFITPGKYQAEMRIDVPDNIAPGTYEIRYGAWNQKEGGRLLIGGAPNDGGRRVSGGLLRIDAQGGRTTKVTWQAEKVKDAQLARDTLLGVNRDGKQVDFGEVITDGSFRLAHPNTGDWILTPLPDSQKFLATLELGAQRQVADVVVAEATANGSQPKTMPAPPTWYQQGTRLTLMTDAQAFSYRIVFKK